MTTHWSRARFISNEPTRGPAIRLRTRRVRFASLLAITAAMPGEVLAQTPSTVASTADGDLAEVLVTANKRPESALKVANAVSAVGGEKLVELGFIGQQDLAKIVPGLTIAGSSNGLGGSVIIRGITTSTAQSSATVGTVVDGVPVGSSTGFGLFPFPVFVNFFDLDRIEVLRGPQGTLYGANTLSGLVSYITKQPSLSSTSGGVDVQLSQVTHGAFGYSGSAGLSTPLVPDLLGIRISGYYNQVPGYLDNPLLGIRNINRVRDYGGRSTMLAEPVDRLKVSLTLNYQNVAGRSDDGVNYAFVKHAPVYGGLVQRLSSAQSFKQELKQAYGSVEYDADFATLTSLTAYSETNGRKNYEYGGPTGAFNALISGGAAPTSLLITPVDTKKFSEEIRFTSPNAGIFRWIVGGFYTHEETAVDQRLIGITADFKRYGPLDPSFRAYIPTTFEEYAAFGNATLDLTDAFQIGGGVRLSGNRQSYQSTQSGPLAVAIGAASTSLLAHSTETVATYSGFARYSLTRSTNVYIRTSTGYRPGGPNLIVPGVPTSFKADRLTNYEAGVKSSFWGNRATVDITAFYEIYDDLQLQTQNVNGLTYIANGNKAVSKGIEFNTTLRPVPGFTFGGNFTALDSHVKQAVIDLGALAGERLPGTARFSGSFSAEYRQHIQAGIVGFLSGIVNYSGKRMTSFTNNIPAPQYTLRSYALAQISAGVTNDRTTLTLSVRNITDKRAELSATENVAEPLIAIAPPRTFAVAVRQLF